jgi:hypothetical protein
MEPLFFQHCEDVDTYFREGREFFNETYVKKLAQTSVYFSRVGESTWPMNSGVDQKGFRFGRGFFDPTKPWKKVVSERCNSNSCDSEPERIIRPGTSSYFWSLMRKELMTDWFCVEDLMYRLLPVEEIMQFEASNAKITRTVHEEFIRASYIGGAGHHWLALVNDDNEYCNPLDDQAWEMRLFTADGETGYDTRYIYVKLDAVNFKYIATLSLDQLDDALVDLGDEDEAFRVDLRDMGILKMDIIVPDAKVARKLFVQAKESNGFWHCDAEFDKTLSDLRLGIPRTIGDYTFAYDGNAFKYNSDSVYNLPGAGGGPTGAGLPAFNANDPTTWPRMVRVMRYVEEPTEIGYHYVPGDDYRRADFGVSIHWMNDALHKWRNPNWTGAGQVKMDDQNYSGDFTWNRPDWECNRKRKMGFFDCEFRLGMQVKDPTIMHVFLHRLDLSKNLTTSPCPIIANYVPPAKIDTYVCQGVGGVTDT